MCNSGYFVRSFFTVVVAGYCLSSDANAGDETKPPSAAPSATAQPTTPVQTSIEGLKEVKTESGLKYWDIKVGDGAAVEPGSKVTVHYSGWLTDGFLFDSSVQRGQPYTTSLNKVVKGWTEGIGSMKIGGKRRLEIPPGLGYGTRGNPPKIPPDATLIFDVELISAVAPPPQPKQMSVEGITPVTTPSGLKYWDLKVGDGPSPQPTSSVTVHYTGWLTDGTMFQSSVQQGQPITMPLNQFVQGWKEGVGSMKVGGKRRLEIPYELAYGEGGKPPTIPPKANLIFEVELISIKP